MHRFDEDDDNDADNDYCDDDDEGDDDDDDDKTREGFKGFGRDLEGLGEFGRV